MIILILIITLIIIPATVIFLLHKPYYTGPVSDHFDGKQFFNIGFKNEVTFAKTLRYLKLKIFNRNSRYIPWPKEVELRHTTKPEITAPGGDIHLTNVGHATFLIQTQGINILTDPLWSDKVGPLNMIGPKRIIKPGIDFEDLPKIDVVWISHNHYDHLDLRTLQRLCDTHTPRIIVPLGTDATIKSCNSSINVEAYDWGDEVYISKDIKLHLAPAYHWSARHLFDQRKALWSALIIETPSGNIYFAGDTAYAEGVHFKAAINKFENFRLALLPMGAHKPRWFMQHVHMNPEDLVRGHIDLGRCITVPYHYDVFPLADENYGQTLEDLSDAMKKYDISDKIISMKIGETLKMLDPY